MAIEALSALPSDVAGTEAEAGRARIEAVYVAVLAAAAVVCASVLAVVTGLL